MTMTTVRELARNFDALGSRKTEILTTCRTELLGSLDEVLDHLGTTGNANGFWKGLSQKIRAENEKAYPLPDQKGVKQAADNYAAGVVERLKERIIFNYSNPAYIAFVRTHGRCPKPGDKLY